MSNEQNKRIDADAGVAMAEWESLFSTELLARAKAIAAKANSDTVSAEHVQKAVGPVVEKLLVTINGEQGTDGKRKAA